MEPDRWQQLMVVVEAAMELESAERGAFLERQSALDSELCEHARRLLASYEEAGSFMEFLERDGEPPTLTLSALSEEQKSEQRIGPYRVVSRIGRGGMGVVYLAIRDDDEYRKRVAIKIVQPAEESEEIVRRLRQERQILASLDHENIAKLLDGGTIED